MSIQPVEIQTPVGRLVMGDCFEPNTTDNEGNPLLIKSGVNKGQPRVDFHIAIAIAKTDPGFADMRAKIQAVAVASFPNLFDASGNCLNPAFAFKIIDGDSNTANSRGNKPCDRIGFPGHWIVNLSNGFAPKCYIYENGENKQVTDPKTIRRGYYVQVYATCNGNGSQNQPGVYLNHSLIRLVGYGEEIVTGKSADDAFGTAPAALPAGASATPVAPSNNVATQTNNTATTNNAPPAPGDAPPAPDILEPKLYNVQGKGYTESQLKAVNYSDAQIAALPLM